MFNYKDVTGIQEKKLELDLLGRKQESILRLADINSWEWNLRQDTLVLTNVTNSNFIKYFCGRGVEVDVYKRQIMRVWSTPPSIGCKKRTDPGSGPWIRDV